MSDIRYNLTDLFALAFGVRNPVFINTPVRIDNGNNSFPIAVGGDSAERPTTQFSGISTNSPVSSNRMSWMGTPIVFPFTFQGGTYRVFSPTGELQDVQLADYELPAATLVDFSRAKVMINSQVRGSNGTVKELFSFADWRIRIRGICLDDTSRPTAQTAQEQKAALLEWEQVAGSIPVSGSLFIEKKIYRLVIDGISFTQLERKPGVIPFEIEAFSDEPLEMVL
jgi:hypothetical protein